jgi:uncharacterized protein DUF3302
MSPDGVKGISALAQIGSDQLNCLFGCLKNRPFVTDERRLSAMSFLDVFALIILFVLVAAAVGVWVILGMLPGRIARQRKHPQAEAIAVCGWWGAITLGLLMPIAFVWAFMDSRWRERDSGGALDSPDPDKEASV